MDHLCYVCLVFVMLSCLFIAALWSPEGKGLTSWLLVVMFIVILLLSHLAVVFEGKADGPSLDRDALLLS